ncbi:MAG: DUF2147 domain-containing protein, partial [Pseudomonadota bacterium]
MIKNIARNTLTILFIIAGIMPAYAKNDFTSPAGYWKSIDDDGKTPKSVIEIWIHKGKAFGKIIKLFRMPGEELYPVCDKCEGSNKNKRIVGMQILQNLKLDDDEWSGGTVMDPNNGKTYKCYIALLDGGKKLKIRGYIGFSLLGRTQYWFRTS